MTGERRQRLGDGLLVADVREHVAKDRQARARLCRDVQPALVHEGQQAQGAQRDGLAARVGAGDDEGRVAVAEAQVDRDHPPREARVARGQEDHLGPVRRLRTDAVQLGCQLGLRRPEVELGEGLERLVEQRGIRGHERGELIEDSALLLLHGRLRLAPRVAQLHDDQRLHEQRLAAPRRVVDDALDLRPGLGADRDHVAAVAHRDERLLERPAQLRAHQRIQAAAEPVVGDPDRSAQGAQARRGGVQELARRVEAAQQRAPQRGQRMEPPAEVAQERPALLGERRGQPCGGVEGVGDPDELLRVEPAAARRTTHPRIDVVGGTDAHAGPFLEQGPGLVRLVEPAADDDLVAGRDEGLREAPGRVEGGLFRQPGADGRELEQGDGSGVHQRGLGAGPVMTFGRRIPCAKECRHGVPAGSGSGGRATRRG